MKIKNIKVRCTEIKVHGNGFTFVFEGRQTDATSTETLHVETSIQLYSTTREYQIGEELVFGINETYSVRSLEVFHVFDRGIGTERCQRCGLPESNHKSPPPLRTSVLEALMLEERHCTCLTNTFAADGSGLIHDNTCLVHGFRTMLREKLVNGDRISAPRDGADRR